jgi:hypothetical protein
MWRQQKSYKNFDKLPKKLSLLLATSCSGAYFLLLALKIDKHCFVRLQAIKMFYKIALTNILKSARNVFYKKIKTLGRNHTTCTLQKGPVS